MDRFTIFVPNEPLQNEIENSKFKNWVSLRDTCLKLPVLCLSTSEHCQSKNKFTSWEETIVGVRNHNYAYKASTSPLSDDIYLVIQIEKSKSGNMYTGEYFGFNKQDDLKMFIISNFIGCKISDLNKTAAQKKHVENFKNFLSILSTLLCQRYYPAFVITAQKIVPLYFEFQKANLLLYLKDTKELISVDEMYMSDTNRGIIKLQAIHGVTVNAIKSKAPAISNSGCKDPDFNSETDNAISQIVIKSFAYVPLLDEKDEVVGVLQLINKDGQITDNHRVYE